MRFLIDYRGNTVRLTDERVRHFVRRLARAGMFDLLDETTADPDFVIQSRTDPSALIHYKFHRGTKVGNKYLCVVVKYAEDDAYVLTAYPSDEIKNGALVWERK